MTSAAIQAEALSRAVQGQSMANYPAIFAGFMAKGISEDQINPRENVFSFNAWKALGRHVKRGEHGVRIATFKQCVKRNKATGEDEHYTSPWHVTVFHISQTEKTEAANE